MKPGADLPNHQQVIKACSKKDLKELYGVSYKTIRNWLKPMASEIGPLHGRYYTAAQAKIIFDNLGYPPAL